MLLNGQVYTRHFTVQSRQATAGSAEGAGQPAPLTASALAPGVCAARPGPQQRELAAVAIAATTCDASAARCPLRAAPPPPRPHGRAPPGPHISYVARRL